MGRLSLYQSAEVNPFPVPLDVLHDLVRQGERATPIIE